MAGSKKKRVSSKSRQKESVAENGKLNPQIVAALIGAFVTIVIALLSFPPIVRLFDPKETPTSILSPVAIQDTPVIYSSTPTELAQLTPTSVPEKVTDKSGLEMVIVPAGEFIIGSDNGDANEIPAHVVYLDSYYIDKTEVTNGAYKLCVRDRVCQQPLQIKSRSRPQYYGDVQFDNYPVVNVDWGMAKAFCEWRNARLPIEAEWEKAARGRNGFNYAWGDAFSCSKGNFDDEEKFDSYVVPGGPNCDGYEDTAPVGSYSAGISVYGLLDINGNVWKWVNSLAQPYPYKYDDGRESPNSSSDRVTKGGSFASNNYYSRSSNRRQVLF